MLSLTHLPINQAPICACPSKLRAIRRPRNGADRSCCHAFARVRPPRPITQPDAVVHSNGEELAVGAPRDCCNRKFKRLGLEQGTPKAVPHLSKKTAILSERYIQMIAHKFSGVHARACCAFKPKIRCRPITHSDHIRIRHRTLYLRSSPPDTTRLVTEFQSTCKTVPSCARHVSCFACG